MTLQEYLFETALQEHNICVKFTHNHQQGWQEIAGHRFGIKFPMSYVESITKLNQDKIYEYCFIGHVDSKLGREKLLDPFRGPNSVIKNSQYGRSVKTKYQYQDDYYQIISNSRFCLCPIHIGEWYLHDWAWTYRFIESVFCKTIPVVFCDTKLGEKFVRDIYYVRDTDAPYQIDDYQSVVEENYVKALRYWTLQPEEIEAIRGIK